jgi:hypothetical protein
MMKITNTQEGPRGINTVAGPMLVEPGQTVEAQVYARERAHIEAAGWFTVDGDYEANSGELVAAPANDDAGKAALISKDQEIADLQQTVKARDTEIARLTKLLPETDIDKMTVAELRAHLAFNDIPFDGKKDKKDDLITLAKAAA